ncbi:helix-turn-helix domain-containing protein [Vitreoscilla stercoraria]|uniref:Helix-turn-helix transcriptional regulator n=3 Tax=Vitreoscilla TaxID=59 RepID=A0ABY4E7R6_VITST|nr:helix-turn-helix transcriptional regulator [Vitreoscilla stercoraria]UOO91378.1 helix-turn-helix transcriptional regulator [Vitreoscilla stercoraria]
MMTPKPTNTCEMSNFNSFSQLRETGLSSNMNGITFTHCKPNYHVGIFPHCNGYTDLYRFNRIVLFRNNYSSNTAQHLINEKNLLNFGINITIKGRFDFHFPDLHTDISVFPMQVWLRRGCLGVVEADIPNQTIIQSVGLDFDVQLLEQLLPDKAVNEISQFFLASPDQAAVQIMRKPPPVLFLLAEQLLDLPHGSNEFDLLKIESISLNLLTHLFADQTHHYHSVPTQIVMAQHILDTEVIQNHTIRQLSKQVGLNECDLKKQFKHHTGLTIASYAKKAKMETALVLLSSGMRPIKVANHLGYCNLHYFTKVFTTYHGYTPNSLMDESK